MKKKTPNYHIRRLILTFGHKYRHTTASRWLILAIDLFSLTLAFAVTSLFRLRMVEIPDWPALIVKLAAFIVISTLCYIGVGTHRGIIRHSGMYDIYKILISNGIACLILIIFNFLNNNHTIVANRFTPSYNEIIMTFTLQIVNMLIIRLFLQRIYNDYIRRQRVTTNIVIYGAGAAGMIAYNALSQDPAHNYKIVAYIDDDRKKRDSALNGIHVMHSEAVLNPTFITKNQIKTLLIAIPTIKIERKQAITTQALDLGLTVKSVPHISKWINDSFTVNQIQNIKIEDLLERESIKLDNINIVREVVDKTVMVTGAAGSIGSEISRQLIQYKPSKIILLDQAESPMYDLQFELRNNEPYKQYADHLEFIIANVKDKHRMEEIFAEHRPQIIYHAAAYKHVPFMEENPYESILVNVFGTKNVADLAIKYGAQKFVMISTDKAVNPTNVMGATKRMAEIYITHKDIIRYFMTIPEACNLVLEAGAMGDGGDIFVFDMGSPVKIYDLAKKMIQLSGLKDIKIVETGLRPGEKLYEELLATKENNMPTYHPKIMRAQVRKYPLDAIDRAFRAIMHNGLPFGGKQVIFAGDMFQLEPIAERGAVSELLHDLYGGDRFYFYKAHVFKRFNLRSHSFMSSS